MRHFSLVLGLLAASALSVMACTSPSEDESQESDIKKKVKPTGGNGAFDLEAPSFDRTGFVGGFSFANVPLEVGARSEKVPGPYTLMSDQIRFESGTTMRQQLGFTLTAGNITTHKLGGLRVRYAEPLSLGAAYLVIDPEQGNQGELTPNTPWQVSATGASMLAIAGKVSGNTATGFTFDVAVTEGALTEVVVPTARVRVGIDAYDDAYPSDTCGFAKVVAGAGGNGVGSANVRKDDGSANFKTLVVPQGPEAPVTLIVGSFEVVQPTLSGKTHDFTLNRLEVDDVKVAKAGGGSDLVRGRVSVYRKEADGSFKFLGCSFPTHSGIDLPDGTYRVASVASAPAGEVTHTADVSFP